MKNALKLTYAHLYFKKKFSGSLSLAIGGEGRGGRGQRGDGRGKCQNTPTLNFWLRLWMLPRYPSAAPWDYIFTPLNKGHPASLAMDLTVVPLDLALANGNQT
jgi:hypothetical protein